ncbi:hypothetical protein BDV36DRAFT_43617 [Aspergillus pseudocaelatus]|uniref:Glycosyl hydrolase family 13 catalytic domain-containing protein n=1 Tax=Aspergillus pseudocaelatus TaxID=1825620 RepID=A0ABQ6W7A2_9EURO|nr:hypothetical protein BDV36DRAFT_43617 [Aspergillus pseudocaelatus]
MLYAFTRGNTSSLPDQVEIMMHNCRDVTTLTTFSENHDIARFASFKKDMNLSLCKVHSNYHPHTLKWINHALAHQKCRCLHNPL